MNACKQNQPAQPADCQNWEQTLGQMMPLLGHRNWIAITDMAYPLQSGNGITTMYADEPYTEVLRKVKAMVDAAPHVFAHVYRDKESLYIPEADAPGIDQLRADIDRICGTEAQCVMHEDLIARLDAAGKLFNVVIIKTPLTIPYTTIFFELDCNYWNAECAERLNQRIAADKK